MRVLARVVGIAAVALAVGAGSVAYARGLPAAGPGTAPVGGAALVADGVPARVRIMPMGDSITFGLGAEDLSSYRVDLGRRLRAAGMDVDFVGSNRSGNGEGGGAAVKRPGKVWTGRDLGADLDHEGHSGWRIAKMAENAGAWVAAYRPDVVLLHIGTNDMRGDAKAKGAPRRLGELIDRILAASPTVRVLVAQIAGAKDERVGGVFQRRIDAFNRRIPAIVAARGERVQLVDQTGVDGTDLLDKLHPNEYGYAKMAWTWYRALEPVLGNGTAWPAIDDPFQVTRKYLREHTSAGDVGRWWHLRTESVERDGKRVAVRRWAAG